MGDTTAASASAPDDASDDVPDGGPTGTPLQDTLDDALGVTEGEDEVSLGELVEAYGARSFGPVLVLFGLLALFPPIGAVPGIPIVLGAALLLFAVQFVAGRDHVWLPSFLTERSFARERLEKAEDRARPWLRRIDRVFTQRLTFATGPKAEKAAAASSVLHALLMIPLEFVSLVGIPGVALTALGVGLMARDGLFMLIGFAATLAAVLALVFVPWSSLFAWLS